MEDHFSHDLSSHGLCFAFVESKHHLLDVVDERLPFNLTGGADVLVLQDLGIWTTQNVIHFPGLRLVIELKKDLEQDIERHEGQAIAEVIAVNMRAPDKSAFVLLTDLRQS